MITRQATFKDFSKLAELVDNKEMIAKWMLYCKDKQNCISLVTIDKKKIIAVYIGEYEKDQKGIKTLLFLYPEEKENVGKFLLDRAIKMFEKVEFLEVMGVFEQHDAFGKMGLKPFETNYMILLDKDVENIDS